jgi:hypothetical protein
LSRKTLGLVTFGLLTALFVLALAVPIGGALGAVLFAVVVVLVGIWFFRFGPYGDVVDSSEELRVNPWLAVVLIVVLGAAFFALRVGLLQSVT